MSLSPFDPSLKKKYTCPHCFKKFVFASSHELHMKSHRKSSKVSQNSDSIKEPLVSSPAPSISTSSSFECLFTDCKKPFNSNDEIITHIKVAHRDKRLERLELSLVFDDECHLEPEPDTQMQTEEQSSEKSGTKTGENPDEILDEGSTAKAGDEANHDLDEDCQPEVIDLEAEEKKVLASAKYSCKSCDVKFTSNVALSYHMTHHDEKLPFPCRACSMRFKNRRGYLIHFGARHGRGLLAELKAEL